MCRDIGHYKRAEALRMIREGHSNKEIADALHISRPTLWRLRYPNGAEADHNHHRESAIARYERQRWSAARRDARPCVTTNAQRQMPAPRPVPETIAAMQREQEHLLKLMASAATPAMYQELARQYSVLQMKIDYAETMANSAQFDLVRSRNQIEKRPLCQIVANGNGFRHH